ncbi:PREDICTED: uncharacterized protein LOC104599522 [Nelumbo nucifera]|uniref:Uncharacterized protein n=2 Tax=Nelumbo nucifera TaxID=4432 RepID=A0A822XQM9_NELNU|nr:PREDICTED: uncharacterized protein LOC104599522 [Nelumbo nucifera]DAD22730.1 TPA_asm: hypothetical protein HUJ06_024193 [Nelumbo nucifera]
MSDNCVMEFGEDARKDNHGKRKVGERIENGCYHEPATAAKRIHLSFMKPSYPQPLYNVRMEHRIRLSHFLLKLLRQHQWKEASGILSVLMKGTLNERSPMKNRMKYTVAMELLNQMSGYHIKLSKIKHIYDIWIRKNGSMKNLPAKDRCVNQLEFVLLCLTKRNTEEAHQAMMCLMQENEYGSDPILNLMIGLIFYELWYSSIPEDMKLKTSDIPEPPTPAEMSVGRSISLLENTDGHKGIDNHEMDSPFQRNSETSIRNDKEVPVNGNGYRQKEKLYQNIQPWGFYMQESAEASGNEPPFIDHGDNLIYASIFSVQGLDACILPLRLPTWKNNLDESIHLYMGMLNDNYNNAMEHLKHALCSTPPVMAALLPLIQLLLLGNRIGEALGELEKLCHNSNLTLPLRLKASLLECFDSKNSSVLSTCYEEILKKDPTCSQSLTRLITMHRNGDYGLETLLEMIASHIDATFPGCDVWGELASCFLNLSQYEEDRLSICGENGGDKQGYSASVTVIPRAFLEGKSRTSWNLRCKWWSTRHFSKSTLISKMQSDELQLIMFKAACASHLYGPKFEYVVSVYTCLDKEENKGRVLFLQKHMMNSFNLHENLKRAN